MSGCYDHCTNGQHAGCTFPPADQDHFDAFLHSLQLVLLSWTVAELDDENQQQQQAASSTARGGSRAPHISLDDPELNIYLRYNTEFRTDMHRAYAIGHRQAFEKATRLELRKALAAHRLELRDYAAATSAKQPPLHEQMLQRLSQMQDYAAGITR
eukprot:gene5198-5436_t